MKISLLNRCRRNKASVYLPDAILQPLRRAKKQYSSTSGDNICLSSLTAAFMENSSNNFCEASQHLAIAASRATLFMFLASRKVLSLFIPQYSFFLFTIFEKCFHYPFDKPVCKKTFTKEIQQYRNCCKKQRCNKRCQHMPYVQCQYKYKCHKHKQESNKQEHEHYRAAGNLAHQCRHILGKLQSVSVNAPLYILSCIVGNILQILSYFHLLLLYDYVNFLLCAMAVVHATGGFINTHFHLTQLLLDIFTDIFSLLWRKKQSQRSAGNHSAGKSNQMTDSHNTTII